MRARLRRSATVAWAIAASIALSAASVAQGWTYVWCAPMQQAQLSCCCPRLHDDCAIRNACCETRSVPTLASGEHTRAERLVAPTPLLAVVPRADLFPSRPQVDRAAGHARAPEARAGPPRRLYREHSVYLL